MKTIVEIEKKIEECKVTGYCSYCRDDKTKIKTIKEILEMIDEINKDWFDTDWGDQVNPLEKLKSAKAHIIMLNERVKFNGKTPAFPSMLAVLEGNIKDRTQLLINEGKQKIL